MTGVWLVSPVHSIACSVDMGRLVDRSGTNLLVLQERQKVGEWVLGLCVREAW